MKTSGFKAFAHGLIAFGLTVIAQLTLAQNDPCMTVTPPTGGKSCGTHIGKSCDAGNGPGTGICRFHSTDGVCECDTNPKVPSYSLSATQLTPRMLAPGAFTGSRVTLSPIRGVAGQVQVTCAVVGAGANWPSCAPKQQTFPLSGAPVTSNWTVTTDPQTPLGSYFISLTASTSTGVGPTNGDLALPLFVIAGQAITYTEVLTGTSGAPVAGTLGGVTFPRPDESTILTLTFNGNTANVTPFSIPRGGCTPNCPLDGIHDGVGFMNFAGKASVRVQSAQTGEVLAQADFLGGAGIFVSNDAANSGIGFGSFVRLPSDPEFPKGGMEVAYPFALFAHPSTDLVSTYSSNTVNVIVSCPSFSGSPGPPSPNGVCQLGRPLPTTLGDLTLETIFAVDSETPPPTGTFVAQTSPIPPGNYTLSFSGPTPSTIDHGTSATATITVSPSNGYSGIVLLTCLSLSFPCQLNPDLVSLRNGAVTSILTLTSYQQNVGGFYEIPVTGRDVNGLPPSSGPVVLTVKVPLPAGGGEMSLIAFLILLGLWLVWQVLRSRAVR